ncbi:MAG: nuclear transport factor 2 family protein [Flammeovirgaceae bacterium]|nr:nuclear transport factor 2 family protein [Flammeovirgaceae bacterium]
MKTHNKVKGCIFIITLFLLQSATFANDHPEIAEVRKVIEQMFDGMRAGDSTKVKSVFDDDARLQTVYVKEGSPLLHTGSIQKFLNAVGTPNAVSIRKC